MEEVEVIFFVFFIPTAIAWYCLRNELMNHVALVLLYGAAMICLLYWVGGPVVIAGETGEKTVHNVFVAYGQSGGSLVGALAGALLGAGAGELVKRNE